MILIMGGEGAPLVPIYHAKIIKNLLNFRVYSYYKCRWSLQCNCCKRDGSFLVLILDQETDQLIKLVSNKFKLRLMILMESYQKKEI